MSSEGPRPAPAAPRDTGGPDAEQGLRLLVVDDHRVFAQTLAAGLTNYPGFASVEVAYSVTAAESMLSTHGPDVLLLDVNLGPDSGLDLLDRVRTVLPQTATIVLSGFEDVDDVIYALSRGARAWVPKATSVEDLLAAIAAAVAGRMWLPPALLGPVLQTLLAERACEEEPSSSFVDDLTPRQLEVLERLADGMSRSEIAAHLVLSPNTVRTHVQDILRKADVHSTLAALALARQAGHVGQAQAR